MKLNFLHESRRYFYFETDPELIETLGPELKQQDIRVDDDGFLKFPKKKFPTQQQCTDWFNDVTRKASQDKSKTTKVLFYDGNVIKQVGEPTDAEWGVIKRFMVNPDRFAKEDIATYEVKLANNAIDRDGERFHEDVLMSFRDTLVGKAFLIGHRWGPPGRGRFFAAALQELDGIQWLTGKFYLLKAYNQELIDHVDAGIWNWVSIGFRAPKRVPIYDPEDADTIKYWEYQNTATEKAEAFEGSLVWLGAQYGAEIRKMFGDDASNVIGFVQTEGGIQPVFGEDIQGKEQWTTAYINTLEDNCFAVVEPTGRKDDEGRTIPKTARHLPHHRKGQGAPGTGGVVDIPHLRNALARMNQIKPVTDTISTEELRRKAKRHLIAHAKKLGIGDYDILEISENDEEVKQILEEFAVGKILKLEKLSLELPVDTEEAIQKAAEQIEAKLSELEKAKQLVEALKDIFDGELEEITVDSMKEMKARLGDAKRYRRFLVEEIVKYGVLVGLIEKAEVENEKQFYGGLEIERLEKERQKLMKKYDDICPNPGVLANNQDPKGQIGGEVTISGNQGNYTLPVS